jgi:small subunit ribosomal protein S6
MVNHYELLYLVAGNYTEEELAPIKEKTKELIKKFNGQITAEDSYGKKKLAYPIKKNNQGYYLIFEFDLAGENLKDLNKNLSLTNEILRHLIAKKSPKAAEVKAPRRQPGTEKIETSAPKITDDKDKIKLEDLDQRLDEILEGGMMQ